MNEFQIAYSNSNAMQTSHRISVPAGTFAVVRETPDYCPVTDAQLRQPARHIVSLHGSRKIAEHLTKRANQSLDSIEDCEVWFVVYPLPTRAERAVLPPVAVDDDVPF